MNFQRDVVRGKHDSLLTSRRSSRTIRLLACSVEVPDRRSPLADSGMDNRLAFFCGARSEKSSSATKFGAPWELQVEQCKHCERSSPFDHGGDVAPVASAVGPRSRDLLALLARATCARQSRGRRRAAVFEAALLPPSAAPLR